MLTDLCHDEGLDRIYTLSLERLSAHIEFKLNL